MKTHKLIRGLFLTGFFFLAFTSINSVDAQRRRPIARIENRGNRLFTHRVLWTEPRGEDVRDRKEDVRDRREDIRDHREDIRDARHHGGIFDRLEDVRDRREDTRDRKEDIRDRREDRRDRRF